MMRSFWRYRQKSVVIATALAILMGVGAQAQTQNDLRAVSERIQRLEAEINQLQRQVSRGDGRVTPSGSPASGSVNAGDNRSAQLGPLMDRMGELETQLSQMTGRFEEIEHRVNSVSQRMDKLIQDMDFRLAQLERQGASNTQAASSSQQQQATAATPSSSASGGERSLPTSPAQPSILGTIPAGPGGRATAAPSPSPPVTTPSAKGKLPAGSPQEQYNYATNLLHKGEYDNAEAALTEFLVVNGKDPLASSAQYWLGESFFARKLYKESAQAFLAGYQKYPKGLKAPDSLLKLGISLQNLKQKQEACAVFKQLQKEYPSAETRIKQSTQHEQQQAGCT